MALLSRLSVSDIKVHINSLGCPECRPSFKTALTDYLASLTEKLCADCIRRRERNPLRVLDCKISSCREEVVGAPSILDYLCPACRQDFNTVETTLETLKVPFVIDKRLVRGLDYYTRTTFEIQTGTLGAQSAVVGGGRYDGLIKALGGPDTPATGFAIGFDRLAEISGIKADDAVKRPDLFLAALGEKSQFMAFEWKCALGLEGISAEMDFADHSLKSQMKRANKLDVSYVLLVGDNEIEEGAVTLRNMETKEQISIPIDSVVENIKSKLMNLS
jgi:histidyl-tRNA synthetase